MQILFGASDFAKKRAAAKQAADVAAQAAKQQQETAAAQQAQAAFQKQYDALKGSLTQEVLPGIAPSPALTRGGLLGEMKGLSVYQRGLQGAEGMDIKGFYFTQEFLEAQGFEKRDIRDLTVSFEAMALDGLFERVTGNLQRREGNDNPNALRGFILTELGRKVLAKLESEKAAS